MHLIVSAIVFNAQQTLIYYWCTIVESEDRNRFIAELKKNLYNK